MIISGHFRKSTPLSGGEGSTLYEVRIWMKDVWLSVNLYLTLSYVAKIIQIFPNSFFLWSLQFCAVFFPPWAVWGCQTSTLLQRLKVAQSNMNKTFFKEICWWKPLNLLKSLESGFMANLSSKTVPRYFYCPPVSTAVPLREWAWTPLKSN